MALGTLTKDEIDNILNQAQQAQPTPNSVPGATLSATKAEIDAILSPQSKPSKQSSGRKKNRDLTDKDAAKKLGQSLLNAAEAGYITADPGYSVAGMADAYAQRIPALGDEPASNVIPFKNYSRDGYSPNEMRSMIDALTGVQNASERRERARTNNVSQATQNPVREDVAQSQNNTSNSVQMSNGYDGPVEIKGKSIARANLSDDQQKQVDKLNARIKAVQNTPLTGDMAVDEVTAKNTQEEINNLQTQIDKIYDMASRNESDNVDYLIDTPRMTKAERKEAKRISDEYFENNPLAKKMSQASDMNLPLLYKDQMTDEQWNEYVRMSALRNKASRANTFGQAAVNTIPGIRQMGDELAEQMGIDEKYNTSNEIARNRENNPLSYLAGDMAAKASEYSIANAGLAGVPMPKMLGEVGGNIARGTIADTLLDTVPNVVVPGIEENKSAGQIALESAGNVGVNALLNGAFEYIPRLFGGGNPPTPPNTPPTGELNPLEMARQAEEGVDALASERQAVADEVQRLSEQIPKGDDVPRNVLAHESADALDTLSPSDSLSDLNINQMDDTVKAEVARPELTPERRKELRRPIEKGFHNAFDGFNLSQDVIRKFNKDADDIIPLIDNLNNATTKEEADKAFRDIVGFVGDRQKSYTPDDIKGISQTYLDDSYSKQEYDAFRDAMNGTVIKLSPEARAELKHHGYPTMKDINNAFFVGLDYSGGGRKAPKFSMGDGTPIDQLFDEIDNNTKGNLSSFMRANGYRTDLEQDQAIGLMEYVKSLKNAEPQEILREMDPNEFATAYANNIMPPIEEMYSNKVKSLASQPAMPEIPRMNEPATPTAPPDIPRMDEPAPRRGNPDNMKLSETYTNTGKNGGGWNEKEYNEYTDPEYYEYESISEKQSVDEAAQMRNDEGREAFRDRVLQKDRISSIELDGLMMEWRETVDAARAAEEAGEDATLLWNDSNIIFKKIQEQSTSNAQALQALAKWSRNTPEGMLMNASNIIKGKIPTDNTELKKTLDRIAKKSKDVELSAEFQKEFLSLAEDLKGLNPDSREAKDIMAKLGRLVNDQIPVKLSEKAMSFLMDNMLGNFRTLITRNAGGNLGLNAMEQTLVRPLAAGLDRLVSNKTGVRKQAGLSIDGLAEYISGFAKGVADEAHDVKTGLHTARSGENTLENAITANRHIFKNKVQDKLDSLVKNGLSIGDRPFYEATYKQTLGDYYRLRETGKMGDVVQNLSDDQFREYAEAAAKLNGLAAVYQNNSKLSEALLGFKKSIGQLSEGTVGVDILSQFSMPFVKTPANVVDRAIDYSPLGIVRNTARTIREGGIGGENFDQNRFVNETARNIIGTGLMGGSVAAAKNGIISGGYSDDPDERKAQKESGMQEYALNLPGGKQMDISWIPVVGSNAVAAAAAYDAYKNSNEPTGLALMKGLEAGGQALFNQAMFQGLQRLFGTGESYDRDSTLVGNMANVVKSGFGQAIPSLLRQVAQVTDKYQRDLAYSNKDVSFGPMDNYDLNALANNIPGLREAVLNPKVDSSGNLIEESQGRGIGSKILEDMILPGKITQLSTNALNDEAQRISAETGNQSSWMPKPNRKDVDTEEHALTNDEWLEYQQTYGDQMTKAGTTLMETPLYQNASDSAKENSLKELYSAVKSSINSDYNDKELDGAAKVYNEQGLDAAIAYIQGHSMIKDAGLSSSSNGAKAVQDLVDQGDAEGAQKLTNDMSSLSDMGIPTAGQSTYALRGQQAFPDMSVNEYADTWKQFDADSNGTISQDEALAGLKDLGVKDDETAQKYWSGFLTDYTEGKTKIPQRQSDGSFKAVKPGEETAAETTAATTSSGTDWASLGITNKYADEAYAKAKGEIPELSPQEYAKTYKSMDSDGNNSLKQDEVIAFLNSIGAGEKYGNQLWKAYGNKTWKKIPVVDSNGHWKKK